MNSLRNLGAAALLSVLPASSSSVETTKIAPQSSVVDSRCDKVRKQIISYLMFKAVIKRNYPNVVPNMEASGRDIAAALEKVVNPINCAAEFLPR